MSVLLTVHFIWFDRYNRTSANGNGTGGSGVRGLGYDESPLSPVPNRRPVNFAFGLGSPFTNFASTLSPVAPRHGEASHNIGTLSGYNSLAGTPVAYGSESKTNGANMTPSPMPNLSGLLGSPPFMKNLSGAFNTFRSFVLKLHSFCLSLSLLCCGVWLLSLLVFCCFLF